MYLKIHRSYRNVVAVCDKNLMGGKFIEDKYQLDIKENFYKGEEMSKAEIIKILKKEKIEDSTFNIVGKESINSAIEAGIISEKGVGEIDGIPYALKLL